MSMANITPVKAIRQKCLECSCGNTAEVRRCVIPECPLYSFRLGKNPNRTGKGHFSAVPPIQLTIEQTK